MYEFYQISNLQYCKHPVPTSSANNSFSWELGIGNWELGIGNWELGIGNWELEANTVHLRGRVLP